MRDTLLLDQEEYGKKYDELRDQFLEMGQLKSDFDIEKFTIKREGYFIAHQFHFLIRQYSLTLIETRRMLIEKEDLMRRIQELKVKLDQGEKKTIITHDHGQKEVYIDLQILNYENHLNNIELDLVNKVCSCKQYELHRKRLIEMNNGEVPTRAQYQGEEPEYWKWFLGRKALWQFKSRQTGIDVGVWENVNYLEEPANIRDDYQVLMLEKGMIPLEQLEREITEKMIEDRKFLDGIKATSTLKGIDSK